MRTERCKNGRILVGCLPKQEDLSGKVSGSNPGDSQKFSRESFINVCLVIIMLLKNSILCLVDVQCIMFVSVR